MNQLQSALVTAGIVTPVDPRIAEKKKARRVARAHRDNLIRAMLGASSKLEKARKGKRSTKAAKQELEALQTKLANVNEQIRGDR